MSANDFIDLNTKCFIHTMCKSSGYAIRDKDIIIFRDHNKRRSKKSLKFEVQQIS